MLIQKILITVALFLIYIFGFGATLIAVSVFNRGILKKEKKKKDTFWRDAEGYSADLEDCMGAS